CSHAGYIGRARVDLLEVVGVGDGSGLPSLDAGIPGVHPFGTVLRSRQFARSPCSLTHGLVLHLAVAVAKLSRVADSLPRVQLSKAVSHFSLAKRPRVYSAAIPPRPGPGAAS